MDTPANRATPEDMLDAQALLKRAPLAFVSVVEGDAPYVVPMNFAFVPGLPEAVGSTGPPSPVAAAGSTGQVLLHSGAGRKTDALAANPKVCVAVVSQTTFVQGTTPCRDGFAFQSVLIEGRATLLDDPVQREQALRTLVAKYDQAAADLPFEEDALGQTLVYAIEIDTLTYKKRLQSE